MPSISVNFGPFRDVGMAASYAKHLQSVGLVPHEAKQAHCTFFKAGNAPQAVHAYILVSLFRKANTVKGRWPFLETLLDTPAYDMNEPDPDASVLSLDLENGQLAATQHHTLESLVNLVVQNARAVVGESVESHSHFADYHFDSLAAVEISTSLGKAIEKDLPVTLVYDFPSVQSVAIHLQSVIVTSPSVNPKLGGKSKKMLNNGAQQGITYQQGPLSVKLSTRLPGKTTSKAFHDDVIEIVPYAR
jgi:acyl carrier protein